MNIICIECGKRKSGQGAKDGVCFMCRKKAADKHQTAEVSPSNSSDLLVAQMRLICDVWKMAESGLADDSEHGSKDSTLRNIVDKIRRVMLTGN